MALPSSGEIKASQINTEAGRSSNAEAPLSGSSPTPQAGSLVKIYENAGVNQSAPHSYSEFYGASFSSSRTLTDVYYYVEGPEDFYYDGSIGDASNLAVDDIIYTDSALTNPIDDSYNTLTQAGSTASTTFCSNSESQMSITVNSSGEITNIFCALP